ncbi:MAG TPA: histidine kinase dimerization/phosphoacceptor domain -containing protein [Xanthobacteraceae bacterium]|nr:histidine kinase dimerization/phosphoacceptor domain -containing protein [Xanthobacteraceae bacterium]
MALQAEHVSHWKVLIARSVAWAERAKISDPSSGTAGDRWRNHGRKAERRQRLSIVKYHPDTREFVVEKPPDPSPDGDVTVEALRQRIQQQQILADFSVLALRGTPLVELLDHATRAVADGLGADFVKVLEFLPKEGRFLVRAGVGWEPGVVGSATVGADTASPAGYALKTGKAVISNHLDIEERFRTPELLIEYGIRRAMNVILGGDSAPFGVLEVDSRNEGEFSERDIIFLRGIANVLGMAIERQRMEESLRRALDRQKVLMREINHRVNNSLQIVAAMLHLHSSGARSEDVRDELRQAGTRITAVARAHQRLYRGDEIDAMDLGTYLREVCRDIAVATPGCEIDIRAEEGLVIRTDRAVPAVLAVNELITNAAKYAYPGRNCRVWVALVRASDDVVAISVRDEGIGLPPDFELRSGRLGIKLVRSFAQQLEGELQLVRHDPGTEFVLKFPLQV